MKYDEITGKEIPENNTDKEYLRKKNRGDYFLDILKDIGLIDDD